MIELLVKYIQDKGYDVEVYPGYLLIRKKWRYDVCTVRWNIFKDDLRPDFEECLYFQATERMKMIEKAIAEREAVENAGMGQDASMG